MKESTKTVSENLQKKIENNGKLLEELYQKRDNLDIQIKNLENKLENQRRALSQMLDKSEG